VRELGIGLISVGWMGRVHTQAYQSLPIYYPELEVKPRLVIAADTSEERAQYAADTLGYESFTTDYKDVLAHPDVDVVSVCAPNFLHEEMGVAAAKAGKALWIEKPAGRTAAETQAIADAVAAAGVASTVGFNYRHAPALEEMRRIVTDGGIGRVTNVRGIFFADYSADPRGALSWRFVKELAGSGVVGDLMGHLVDLAQYVVGSIDSVTGLTSTVHSERPELPMGSGTHFAVIEDGEMKPVENEDYGGALVRFGGGSPGAVGTLEASRVAVGPRSRYELEVYGTEGSMSWDFERMNELQLATGYSGNRVGYQRLLASPHFGDFGRFQPGAGPNMGYDDLKIVEAGKFIEAFLGLQHRNTTLIDAVSASRVLDGVLTTAETGGWASIDQPEGTTHQPGQSGA